MPIKIWDSVPQSYFETRKRFCAWARPTDKSSMASYLQSISAIYDASFESIANGRVQFIKLTAKNGDTVLTHFAISDFDPSFSIGLLEEMVYRYLEPHGLANLQISFPFHVECTKSLNCSNIEILSHNWFVRLAPPPLAECSVTIEPLSVLNLAPLSETYSAVVSRFPGYAAPSIDELKLSIEKKQRGLEPREFALFLRENRPVGVVAYQKLLSIGTVIDFYGFIERNEFNTRSLYALVCTATGSNFVCGVKDSRLLDHVMKCLPETEIEKYFSHTRVSIRRGSRSETQK